MPILAGLLVTLFGSLFQAFLKFASQKVALAAAAITTFGALTVALLAGLSTIIAGLHATLPNMPGLMTGIWVAMPDSTVPCIGAYFAADTAIALYAWNTQNLRLAAYVT